MKSTCCFLGYTRILWNSLSMYFSLICLRIGVADTLNWSFRTRQFTLSFGLDNDIREREKRKREFDETPVGVATVSSVMEFQSTYG